MKDYIYVRPVGGDTTSICPATHEHIWRLHFPPYCVKHRIAGFLSGLHNETSFTYKGVTWTWELKECCG